MIITACTTESSLETLGSNLSTLIIFDLDLATPSTVFRTANMHPFTAYALGAAFLGLVVYAAIEAFTKYDKRYNVQNMPGPWLVPWVGRIHDLPIEFMWLKFQEWANTYGPIYRTKMLGANFVVITDEKIAEDMLVKKAKLYSDRPEIKSLFDAKSTYGSMEYLPLMGKNRKLNVDSTLEYC